VELLASASVRLCSDLKGSRLMLWRLVHFKTLLRLCLRVAVCRLITALSRNLSQQYMVRSVPAPGRRLRWRRGQSAPRAGR